MTHRLTTIELLAELQARDVQPRLMAELTHRAFEKAAVSMKFWARPKYEPPVQGTIHPDWAEPKRWPERLGTMQERLARKAAAERHKYQFERE